MGYRFVYRKYKKGFIHIFMVESWINSFEFDEIVEWCVDQFGDNFTSGATDDTARWYLAVASHIVGFRRDEDAFAFKMRWWG